MNRQFSIEKKLCISCLLSFHLPGIIKMGQNSFTLIHAINYNRHIHFRVRLGLSDVFVVLLTLHAEITSIFYSVLKYFLYFKIKITEFRNIFKLCHKTNFYLQKYFIHMMIIVKTVMSVKYEVISYFCNCKCSVLI